MQSIGIGVATARSARTYPEQSTAGYPVGTATRGCLYVNRFPS